MKKTILIYGAFLALFGLISCDEEDYLVFTAQPDPEGVNFENSFSSQYLLSEDTGTNIAERFFWNPVDFDAPVNITYDLEASLDSEFNTPVILGSTSATNQAVTVDQMLEFAEDLGLDDDPATTGEDGLPNNTGQVYFRIHAYSGTGAANTVQVYSDAAPLTLRIIEQAPDTGGACASIYVVGAAAVDAGWEWSSPIEFFCDGDVYTARVELTNDTFRFFETEGDWASGLNYPYFEEEGYTIDENLINAADGDSNFSFVGTPGIYEVVVDSNEKAITLTPSTPYYLVGDGVPTGWNWDEPVVNVVETSAYIRTATLEFSGTGVFRVFTSFNDWNSGINYPSFEEMGYTIDENFENAGDGDSNFSFVGTPGTYTMTINTLEKTISLE